MDLKTEKPDNLSKSHFIIGTRGSLLALAQCTLIKEELEKNTNATFELQIVKTQGDQVQDKPLWQMEGKDFFTKELDEKLLNKQVDIVVHSYKDLGSQRPIGITLGAITERKFAHDILIMSEAGLKKLQNSGKILIGTSSPRRMFQLEENLKSFLPYTSSRINLQIESLRGNVNSRLEKLQNQHFDGIVLALAGLERLCAHESSNRKILELLKKTHFKILPLSIFPSAPGQGALAIEYLNDKSDHSRKIQRILSTVNDLATTTETTLEKKYFQKYGGGCHLAIGINVQTIYPHPSQLIHINGKIDSLRIKENFHQPILEKKINPTELFIGLSDDHQVSFYKNKNILFDSLFTKKILPLDQVAQNLKNKEWLFLASKNCHHLLNHTGRHQLIWVSGAKSQEIISQQSLCWVSGDNDSLGETQFLKFQNSDFWKIWHKANFDQEQLPIFVCTGEKSSVTIPLAHKISCYDIIRTPPNEKFLKELQKRSFFYWTSPNQFEHYNPFLPKNAFHFCGPGKTFNYISHFTKNIAMIPRMSDFKNLINDLNQ